MSAYLGDKTMPKDFPVTLLAPVRGHRGFGTISIQGSWQQIRKSTGRVFEQLIWRDFYQQILHGIFSAGVGRRQSVSLHTIT
jgi:deoxyribodipyrimidine photolyase